MRKEFLHQIGLSIYTKRLIEWFIECFGKHELTQTKERTFRFFEEAVEFAQAAGMSKEDCLKMVSLVYSKPPGEIHQEIGGVYTTLIIYCESNGISLAECGEKELKRINEKIPLIREKQKTKLHPSDFAGTNTHPSPVFNLPNKAIKLIKAPPRRP